MKMYQEFYGKFEYGFFASCTLGILVSSCLGGIAAMAVLQNGTSPMQVFQLFLVVASCMMFNGSVLSQQKPKVVFNLMLLSFALNSALAIWNFATYFTR